MNRMTPYDPTGAGRTLDARDMRIDGQAVAADGTFPGLEPTVTKTDGGPLPVTMGPGEAVVLTLHDQYAETVREGAVGGSVPATLSLSLEAPGLVRDVHAGSGSQLSDEHDRDGHVDRGRCDAVRGRSERDSARPARERLVRAR